MRIKTPLVLLITAGFFLAHSPAVNQHEPAMEQISTNKAVVQDVSRGVVRERILIVEATAYCLPTPTFTGHKTHIGIIAVDPKAIPLYSRVWVEGYGYATALDTGRDIKGNRIDIWLPDYRQCMKFGRKTLEIKILEE